MEHTSAYAVTCSGVAWDSVAGPASSDLATTVIVSALNSGGSLLLCCYPLHATSRGCRRSLPVDILLLSTSVPIMHVLARCTKSCTVAVCMCCVAHTMEQCPALVLTLLACASSPYNWHGTLLSRMVLHVGTTGLCTSQRAGQRIC